MSKKEQVLENQAEKKKEIEQAVVKAKAILKGAQEEPEACFELAEKLLNNDQIGWARRLLNRIVECGVNDINLGKKIAQKRAQATYEDTQPQMNRDQALDRAIEILGRAFDLQTIEVHETLGLAGSICKRKWEVNNDKRHLERSLKYYQRGFEAGIKGDKGYTAINAAFILDLLAYLEDRESKETGGTSKTAKERRNKANEIRNQIVDYLEGTFKNKVDQELDYWSVVTLAEAYFGLQEYEQAKKWLAKAREITQIAEWKYVSTAKQLVHLAQIQMCQDHNGSKLKQTCQDLSGSKLEQTRAWMALIDFLGQKADALRTLFQGKLGLALSGGGFRASLYHIGVLAKLAELDLLRHVEVLSCVSGGSIVGAHYYLELRRMFQVEKKKDQNIDRDDYVRLIETLAEDFTAGVQQNPRARILANPWANLKMIFFPSYSRTQRLGELYESLIYKRVKDGEGGKKRWLTDLYISPREKQDNFLPRRDNWARRCKVPELVLNATTLNTGHNWQFTASWMGESPISIDADVDANDRYRRMYYREAPKKYQKVRLGYAVSASSCVPGLFEPIIMKGLYPGTTVRLVDGGVYDNQGVATLLEQDCNVIIASDATGQLNTEKDPGGGMMKPLMRMNSTLMQRVRNAQYQDLKARKSSSVLKDFAYMHLKQGLDGKAVDWVDCEEPPQTPLKRNTIITPYEILKNIQELLSGVRTDLDSFTDIEACALMTSGYRATELAIKELKGFPPYQGSAHGWDFLKVEPEMKQKSGNEKKHNKLKCHLEVSSMRFFKVWKLSWSLNVIAIALGLGSLGAIAYAWHKFPGWKPFAGLFGYLEKALTLELILSTILIIGVSYALVTLFGNTAKVVKWTVKFKETLHRILIGAGVGIVGWVGAFIHLHVFDRIFKALGRLR